MFLVLYGAYNPATRPQRTHAPSLRITRRDCDRKPLRRGTRHSRVLSRLEDVIIHRGVTVSGRSRSGGGIGGSGTILGVVGDEVVGHLRVKLLGSLLRGAAVAATTGLGPGRLARSASLGAGGSVSTVLDCGGRLRLSLGLATGAVSNCKSINGLRTSHT